MILHHPYIRILFHNQNTYPSTTHTTTKHNMRKTRTYDDSRDDNTTLLAQQLLNPNINNDYNKQINASGRSYEASPLMNNEIRMLREDNNGNSNEASQGTLISSTFMIFNSAVGTGILTLPYAFRTAGLYGGMLLLLFYVLIEVGCIYSIIIASERSQQKIYSGVVKSYFGERFGFIFAIVIAVYCFFTCAGGFIIVKNVISPILLLETNDKTLWWNSQYMQVFIAGIIVLPFLLLRHITSLRFTAQLSFYCIIFVVGVVVAEYYLRPSTDFKDSILGPLDKFGEFPSFILAIPNIFLSLQSHVNIPSIYAEMKPSIRSANNMLLAAVLAYTLVFILYSLIGVYGVMTFRRLTLPNILECAYDPSKITIIVARICLAITGLFSIPVNHHPSREATWQIISGGKSSDKMTKSFLVTATIVFFILAMGLAVFINELSTLNDLRGMTIGVIIIFILPGFFLLHESKCSIVGMIYVLVGILSFLVSAYSFVGTKFYDLTPMEIPKYIPTSGNVTR